MLAWRIGISCVLIPLLIGLFWLDASLGSSAWILGALCVVLAARSAWELSDLLHVRQMRPDRGFVMLGAMTLIVLAWLPHLIAPSTIGKMSEFGPLGLGFSLLVCVSLLRHTLEFLEPGAVSENLGADLLIMAYSGMLLGATAQLRWVVGPAAGYLVLGSLLMAVKGGDIGGYAIGRLFGRRKLAPRLSPGKTWAGAVGACGAAALAAWGWLTWAPSLFDASWRPASPAWALGYGLAMGLIGLVGDLCESLIKRDVGRKDAAALFPGFGGLLDLLDSIVFAGPFAYLFWKLTPLAASIL